MSKEQQDLKVEQTVNSLINDLHGIYYASDFIKKKNNFQNTILQLKTIQNDLNKYPQNQQIDISILLSKAIHKFDNLEKHFSDKGGLIESAYTENLKEIPAIKSLMNDLIGIQDHIDPQKNVREKPFKQDNGVYEQMNNLFKKVVEFNTKKYNPTAANAAKNVHQFMEELCNQYIHSKISKDQFTQCIDFVFGKRKSCGFTLDANFNLDRVRKNVNTLKTHRTWWPTIANLVIACCTFIIPYALTVAYRKKLHLFYPATDSGRKLNQIYASIKKMKEEAENTIQDEENPNQNPGTSLKN